MKLLFTLLSLASLSLFADAPSDLQAQDIVLEQEGDLKLSLRLVPQAEIARQVNAENAQKVLDDENVWEARVGDLAYLIAEIQNADGPVKDVLCELSFHHVEDDKEVFKTSFLAENGKMVWGQQFFDGAEHLVTLKITPVKEGEFKPLKAEMLVGVEGIDPPSGVVMKTMAILLGLSAFAMFVGYIISLKIGAKVKE